MILLLPFNMKKNQKCISKMIMIKYDNLSQFAILARFICSKLIVKGERSEGKSNIVISFEDSFHIVFCSFANVCIFYINSNWLGVGREFSTRFLT